MAAPAIMHLAVAAMVCLAGTAAADGAYFTLSGVGDDAPFYCLPQAYPECVSAGCPYPWPAAFTSAQASMRVISHTLNCDEVELSKRLVYDAADLSYLQDNPGTIAVAQMVSCEGDTMTNFVEGYYHQMESLLAAGAAGAIVAEMNTNRLPQLLLDACVVAGQGFCQRLPACHIMKGDHDRVVQAQGSASSVGADCSNVKVWRRSDEPTLSPIFSPLSITHGLGNNEVVDFVPASTCSFNPDFSGVDAPVALAVWAGECRVEDPMDCGACWELGSPLTNAASLGGKVVLYQANSSLPGGRLSGGSLGPVTNYTGGQSCFTMPYHFAVIAQKAGAVGAILDTGHQLDWFAGAPYLVPAALTLPMFLLDKLYAESIEYSIFKGGDAFAARVALPEIKDRVGPPYFAQGVQTFSYAQVGFWVNPHNYNNGSATSADDSYRHFDCIALETLYSPKNHSGFNPPDLLAGVGTRLVKGEPSQFCRSLDKCSVCLTSSDQLAARHEGSVVLMVEEEFPCFHHRSQYTKAAANAGALGIVMGLTSDIVTVGLSDGYTAEIPTFMVDSKCTKRALVDADPHFVSFPETRDGDPLRSDWNSVLVLPEEAELTYIKVEGTLGVYGNNLGDGMHVVTAGQSTFNPPNHRSVGGELVAVQVSSECNLEFVDAGGSDPGGGDDCVACDLLSIEDKFVTKLNDTVRGRVVLFPEKFVTDTIPIDGSDARLHTTVEQGHCLRPWANVVQIMAVYGAVAVVFVNDRNVVVTMGQQGLPAPLPIPSFNIRMDTGLALMGGLLEGDKIVVHVPRLGSLGMSYQEEPYELFTGSDGSGDTVVESTPSPGPGGGGSTNVGMIAGVVVGCVMGVVIGIVGYRVWRKKYVFAYNQLDRAMQTGDGWINPFDEDPLLQQKEGDGGEDLGVYDVDGEAYGDAVTAYREEAGAGAEGTPMRTLSSHQAASSASLTPPNPISPPSGKKKGMIVHSNSTFEP